MNVKYKIGDRVRLKKSSEYYPEQSGGTDGTIISWEDDCYEDNYLDGHTVDYQTDDTFYFRIRWDNGKENCYRILDIEPSAIRSGIRIPEVGEYIKVTDSDYPGVMYVQITKGFSMESDGHLRGQGNLITFEKKVISNSRVSIQNLDSRRFESMTNSEIVWMNTVLEKSLYISYESWNPSFNENLKIQVLDRYPNLKVGEKFGFEDGEEVKSIHPRKWTVGSDYVYLAPSGQGGAMVYKNGVWADRSGYIDPSKGVTPPVKENSFNVNDVVQATNTYSSAAFRIDEVFRVIDIEGEHIWIKIRGSNRKEPAKYFKKIDLIGKKVEIMRDGLYSAGVKEGDVLRIENIHSNGNLITNKGWVFPISIINDKNSLVLLDDQKVEKVKVQIHDTSSSTTHLPYLNIGTKEKKVKSSFIEDVGEIRVTKKVSKKSNRLTI